MSFNTHTKICPFQTFSNNLGIVTGVKCAQDSCEMWVPAETPILDNNPDLFSINIATNNPDGTPENSENNQAPSNINQYHTDQGGRCGMKTSDYNENLFRMVHHLHRHHEHPRGHSSCKKIPFGCGDYYFGNFNVPTAIKLIQELESDEDFDGNGKIFGKDFEIDPTQAMPPILENILTNITKNPPVRVSWSNFKINKFPPYIKNIYPLNWNVNGGMRVRVTGALFDGRLDEFEIRIKEKDSPAENEGYRIPVEDVNIVDKTKLFFTVPAYPGGEYIEMHLYFKNAGDTFDMGGFLFDVLTDTGGETVTTDRKFYTTEEDDPLVLQANLDEEETYNV